MKKIILLLVLAITVGYIINNKEYVEIPSTSIRLRVIAASNSKKDQEDKLKIKNAITNKINKSLKDADSYENANAIMDSSIDDIKEIIKNTIDTNNIDSDFTINYGLNYFPEKTYKGVTYKAGNYQSLVVTLNEGKGENWWCALYPPLCKIDDSIEPTQYRSLIKDIISQYN